MRRQNPHPIITAPSVVFIVYEIPLSNKEQMKFKPLRTNIYSAGLSQQLLKVLSNKSVLCPAPLHRTRPGQEECVRLLTSPAATEYIKQI